MNINLATREKMDIKSYMYMAIKELRKLKILFQYINSAFGIKYPYIKKILFKTFKKEKKRIRV